MCPIPLAIKAATIRHLVVLTKMLSTYAGMIVEFVESISCGGAVDMLFKVMIRGAKCALVCQAAPELCAPGLNGR